VKKPILMIVIKDKNSRKLHQIVARNLIEPEIIRGQVNSNYLVYGIYDRPTDAELARAL
jgi:hypothetical protein